MEVLPFCFHFIFWHQKGEKGRLLIDCEYVLVALESIQWDSGQRSHAFEVDGAKAPAFSFKKLSQNSPQRRIQCEQKPEREKSFKVNEFKAGESPYFLTKEKAN